MNYSKHPNNYSFLLQLQIKVENRRQIASPAKSKPPPIDWGTANKTRKRGPNKLNSPNNTSRIQQLYNSHNSKATNAPPSQRKSVSGSTASSAKTVSVTNKRRKSELLSPNARNSEPSSAAVHSTEHSIGDNEYQLREEEVDSVPLHSHHYKFNAIQNDANVQMTAVKQALMQTQQTIVTNMPNSVSNLPRIGTARSNQTQIIYQQQAMAPILTKATPAVVATPNAMHENSTNQSNGPTNSTSQFASHRNSNVTPSATIVPTTSNQRIPPKINILSQQTITKSNINFVPLADNKIIIKSDSKLANAFKSQKLHMIPGQMSSPASSSASSVSSALGGNKMHSQNNLIIRGTSQHTMHQPKVFSVPLNSNHQNAQAFYVNMPTTQSPTSIHTIEKVITDETPVEIIAAESDDYIIDETTGTAYELVEQNVDDTAAYVTTTTKIIEPSPVKRIKLSNSEHRSHDNRQRASFVTPKLFTNNDLVSTIIYEEQPTSTDWEYELDYEQGGKQPNGNAQTIVTTGGHAGEVVIEDDATEYHDSNIIYTEEEVIDDENVVQEEYVTTEVFSPNGKALSICSTESL